MFSITKTINNECVKLALEGRLDTNSAPELDAAVHELPSDVSELILDLEKMDYISSAGLRVVLSAQKLMKQQGKMKVVNVNDNIMGIFEITRFVDILTIE